MKLLQKHYFFSQFPIEKHQKLLKYSLGICAEYLKQYFQKSTITFQEIKWLSTSLRKMKNNKKNDNPTEKMNYKNQLISTNSRSSSLQFHQDRILQVSDLKGVGSESKQKYDFLFKHEVKDGIQNLTKCSLNTKEIKAATESKNEESPPITFEGKRQRNIEVQISSNSNMLPSSQPIEFLSTKNNSRTPFNDSNKYRQSAKSDMEKNKTEINNKLSTYRQKTYAKSFKKRIKNLLREEKNENENKQKQLPLYLKKVESKIKHEIEFHKKMFRESKMKNKLCQLEPNIEINDLDKNNQIDQDFLTFANSIEQSPIKNNNLDCFEKTNEFCKENRDNSNIIEIANTFLKSPLMVHLTENNIDNNITNNYNKDNNLFSDHRFRKEKRRKSLYNNENTFSLLYDKKDLKDFSDIRPSYLFHDSNNNNEDTSSSIFSMLIPNEDLKGFFQKEQLLADSEKKIRMESEVGKIKRNKESNQNNIFLNGKLC